MALQKSDGMDANESAEKGHHAKKRRRKMKNREKWGVCWYFFWVELYVWRKTTKEKKLPFLYSLPFQLVSAVEKKC